MANTAFELNISGIVQGVGFRPFVFRLARKHRLCGHVTNTMGGVQVYIEGAQSDAEKFLTSVRAKSPEISVIEDIEAKQVEPRGAKDFAIRKSESNAGNQIYISPDLSTCADCKSDILDEENRRHRYPFTTCTYCGPRYSIIRDIPYDREYTVMAEFEMCENCRAEYDDPADRRYHSQPNACAECGPKLTLYDAHAKEFLSSDEAIGFAADALQCGKIVAVKGLGGYLLCCDAKNNDAVAALRERKQREEKPFAIMCKDAGTTLAHCEISPEEKEMLLSPHNPIVLLKKRADNRIAPGVSRDNEYLGVMLPYTPIHILLMEQIDTLVMTSANISDMPIISDDDDAIQNLTGIADYILMHNREIYARVDDSVYKVVDGAAQAIRRARGYTPGIIKARGIKATILAVGGELKNTFALNRGDTVFVGPHIGDLKYAQTYDLFRQSISEYQRLLGLSPEVAGCDMHPGYLSTVWAEENFERVIKVQHHHAHLAGTLLEYGLQNEEAIGICMDGTGYGTDGAIWGCESGIVSAKAFERRGHLNYFSLPGGDKCATDVYRCAISLIGQAAGTQDIGRYTCFAGIAPQNIRTLQEMIEKNIGSISTSSMGRLFDGVSCLLGLGGYSNYEASAAIRLEHIAGKDVDETYTVRLQQKDGMYLWMWEEMVREILIDIEEKTASATISAKFHNSVIEYMVQMARVLGRETGLKKVALSGGVFGNTIISAGAQAKLSQAGFEVYLQRTFPANDGGLCIGQMIAANEVI